jgi:outer membrane protein OmpA-like peptidoglycan-associated protein
MNSARSLITLLLFACCTAFFPGPAKQSIKTGHPFSDYKSNLPDKDKDTVLIRFDYKQSALYHTFTFDVLDSVVNILIKNKEVTISIDGYAYKDEGNDTICYYLSLNRALFIQTYIMGRGIDSSQVTSVVGHGKSKPMYKGVDKDGFKINCRAEITLNYPPKPVKIIISDRDSDGISDTEDKCPDEYGYVNNNGCPNKGFVLVPFEIQQTNLFTTSYKILDSVINVLALNPALNILIEGHAYKTEGIGSVCDRLATERAQIVKNYFLSRRLDISRIESVKSFGYTRPLNAGSNPREIQLNSRTEIYFSSH